MAKKNKSKYEVGYKKPPRTTQFKPGQSGNPRGRPKKAATAADLFLKQARKIVSVTIGNQPRRVSMLEAIVMKHTNKAASGDPKSTALVLNALRLVESDQGNNIPELLNEFRAIHASRERGGRILPQSAGTGEDEHNRDS